MLLIRMRSTAAAGSHIVFIRATRRVDHNHGDTHIFLHVPTSTTNSRESHRYRHPVDFSGSYPVPRTARVQPMAVDLPRESACWRYLPKERRRSVTRKNLDRHSRKLLSMLVMFFSINGMLSFATQFIPATEEGFFQANFSLLVAEKKPAIIEEPFFSSKDIIGLSENCSNGMLTDSIITKRETECWRMAFGDRKRCKENQRQILFPDTCRWMRH
jgi:hypothetical protein